MATESTNTANEYLSQLLEDKKQLAAFPKMFKHVDRLLDEGIYYLDMLFFRVFKQGCPNQVNCVLELSKNNS